MRTVRSLNRIRNSLGDSMKAPLEQAAKTFAGFVFGHTAHHVVSVFRDAVA